MKNSQLAWLLGGALVLSSGVLGVAACSSSNTGNPTGGVDSGTGSDGGGGTDTGTGTDTGNGGTDSGGGTDGGGTCTSPKSPSLHPSDGGAGSLFCGYLGNDAGRLDCTPQTQVCCLGGKQGTGFADPTCNAPGTPCANGTNPKEFQCGDPTDCASGSICCLGGPAPTLDPVCGYYKAKGTTGSKCETTTTCAAGETKLCESNAECAAGQTCTPFKTLILQFGFCSM